MPKMIQIRNVPDDLHRQLKLRAVHAGMSLSDYLLSEVREIADKPTLAEWTGRVANRPPSGVSSDQVVAAVRAARDEM
jgi:plasmid stability protein